jgi:microcin C transport system substrate-binding protein
MKKILSVFGVMLALIVSPMSAVAQPAWQHAISLYGTPKYPKGFRYFDYVNPNAPKGGTLKLASLASFDSVNPYILKGLSAPGLSNIYESLMEASYDEPQTYYGVIAEAVRIDMANRVMDVRINRKARFEDGEPITPEDVVFSLKTFKTKGHPIYKILYKEIRKAEAIDAHTVRFYFSKAEHRELPLIVAGMSVLPKHFYDKVPFEKTSLIKPVGNGPYRVSEIVAGRSITYERIPDWWGDSLPNMRGRYNFDKITIDVYRDDVVAVEAIKSGQIDYYEEYIARNFATAYNIPALARGDLIKAKIEHKIPRGMQAFIFNLRRDKFADARVREAIGLTMDFEWMNKKLFYDAYLRSRSFFGATPFEAKGTPEGAELALLATHRSELSEALFEKEFAAPATDGSGYARGNLEKAQKLLDEAGWVMRDGVRVNEKTGEALTLEFLMSQRTFERVVAIMRKNLAKLGIDSAFRYVDSSQYQKRLDARDFDMVSIWWNQGTHYPGAEQITFWHSSQADVAGSQNLAGLKNPLIDSILKRIAKAHDLNDLTPAARALDRVLQWGYYVIPHWYLNSWRVIYWNKFGRPAVTPDYNIGIETWWMKSAETAGKKR